MALKLADCLSAETLSMNWPGCVAEFKFHPVRKWRFDFCWPERKLALEIEGGAFVGGRHTRGAGYEKDIAKYNEATALGWRVLRATTGMVKRGEIWTLLDRMITTDARCP